VDKNTVTVKPTITALAEFNNAKDTLNSDPLFHSREITERKILLNDNRISKIKRYLMRSKIREI
jgi:hypothetical protein